MTRTIVRWHPQRGRTVLRRRTIRSLALDEAFLEARIAESPELLGIDDLAKGVRGPFRVFRQVALETPTGRVVSPDIVLVSASAHLFVVEVKLEDNVELRNRAVIAQVVDYASALAALDVAELADLLGASSAPGALGDAASRWFPDVDALEFARVLGDRCARGEIDLVIACDRFPPGLEDLGRAFGQLSALAFDFQVIEVTPWVADGEPDEICFSTATRVKTEIVARTVVQVDWTGHAERPAVRVSSTPLQEIDEGLELAREGGGAKRDWSANEIRSAIASISRLNERDRASMLRLLDFCCQESVDGRVTNRRTVHPTFAFRVAGVLARTANGRPFPLWTVSPKDGYLYVVLINLEYFAEPDAVSDLRARISAALGSTCKEGSDFMSVQISAIGDRIDAFLDLSRELKSMATR